MKHPTRGKNIALLILLTWTVLCVDAVQASNRASVDDSLSLIISDSLYVVENEYYRVEVDRSSGGCIKGIYSKKGSEENLIQAITVSVEESFGWGRTFSQIFDPSAKVQIVEDRNEKVVLNITARLKSMLGDDSGVTVINTLIFHSGLPFFSAEYQLVFHKNMSVLELAVEAISSNSSSFNVCAISINGSEPFTIPLLNNDLEVSNQSRGYVWYDLYNEDEGIGFIAPRAEDFASRHTFSLLVDRESNHKIAFKWEACIRGTTPGLLVKEGSVYRGKVVYNIHGKMYKTTGLLASILAGSTERAFMQFLDFLSSHQQLENSYNDALKKIAQLEDTVEKLRGEVNELKTNLYTYAQERLLLMLLLSLSVAIVVVALLGIL